MFVIIQIKDDTKDIQVHETDFYSVRSHIHDVHDRQIACRFSGISASTVFKRFIPLICRLFSQLYKQTHHILSYSSILIKALPSSDMVALTSTVFPWNFTPEPLASWRTKLS